MTLLGRGCAASVDKSHGSCSGVSALREFTHWELLKAHGYILSSFEAGEERVDSRVSSHSSGSKWIPLKLRALFFSAHSLSLPPCHFQMQSTLLARPPLMVPGTQ